MVEKLVEDNERMLVCELEDNGEGGAESGMVSAGIGNKVNANLEDWYINLLSDTQRGTLNDTGSEVGKGKCLDLI